MLRLAVFLAVIVAANSLSGSNEDLLKRLLRILDEDREVEKREMYLMTYDGNSNVVKVGFQICVVGDKGKPCSGREGHLFVVFDTDTKKEVEKSVKTFPYADSKNNAPSPRFALSEIKKGGHYLAVACEITKGGPEKCNGFKFTGGESAVSQFNLIREKDLPAYAKPASKSSSGNQNSA